MALQTSRPAVGVLSHGDGSGDSSGDSRGDGSGDSNGDGSGDSSGYSRGYNSPIPVLPVAEEQPWVPAPVNV